MTINSLINEFRDNFHSLFEETSKFELRVEFEDNIVTPVTRGVGDKMRILLPQSTKDIELDNEEKEIMFLLTLAHETAHFINNHNSHIDRNFNDSTSIELWADFFGGKILLTICCFTEIFNTRYKFESDFVQFLKWYYSGLNGMFDAYYLNEHAKYPSKYLRYQVGHTAVTSFLTTLENGNFCSERIIKATKLFSDLSSFDKVEYSEDVELESLMPIIGGIHTQLMNGENEITGGLKEDFKNYIGTEY